MATAKVKVAVSPSNFAGIASLAANVISGLTANPGNFPTPDPTVGDLTTAYNNLTAAIATWGPVHARGSHADWVNLVAAATICRDMIFQEAAYVQNQVDPTAIYSVQAAFIVTSGFSVKNLPVPQGVLNPPENLRRLMSLSISEDDIMLDWEKPLGLTSPNNVKFYTIVNNGGPLPVQTSTKTKLLISNPALVHGNVYQFSVAANNDQGTSPYIGPLIINF